MDNTSNHDRTVTNAVRLDILAKQFEQFDVDNHNDHHKLFEALDEINQRLTIIETKLTVEKEQERKEMTLRIWLIGLFISSAFTIIDWVLKIWKK